MFLDFNAPTAPQKNKAKQKQKQKKKEKENCYPSQSQSEPGEQTHMWDMSEMQMCLKSTANTAQT